mgnify:CR=1 FL=1
MSIRYVTEKTFFRGRRSTFSAAYVYIREACIRIIPASAKLCQGTRKIKRVNAFGQKVTVLFGQGYTAAAESDFAARTLSVCEDGGIAHRGAYRTVATDDGIGLVRRLVIGSDYQGSAV